jgi:hypothetical protein
MAYNIAGIDVHKKKLAVVVADVEVEEAYQFERRWYGSNPEQLQLLAKWLIEQQVEEVVTLAGHAGTVMRRAGCLYRAQYRLPPAAEDGAARVAIYRAADW